MDTDDRDFARVFRRRHDVEWVVIDGETVLYDPATESVHMLNTSASVVWAACDGSASVDAIATALAGPHPGAPIRHDVLVIVARLRDRDLLEAVGSAPP